MRLVFMGTPDFSVPILSSLVEAGHEIACVYSQPPRPAGRGHKEQLSPVHAWAASHNLPVRTPKSLKSAEDQQAFADLNADAAVVAAYGLILPKPILQAPSYGCFNVHASLLPRWRGAAPIQRAILAGDYQSGITIMQMDEGLDTGDILLEKAYPIDKTTTGQSLHDALSVLGATMMVEALQHLQAGTLSAKKQPAEGVTYAAKLTRDEGWLDWSRSAEELERAIRAFYPWPGAWFSYRGERIKVLAAEVVDSSGVAGCVLDQDLTIACQSKALRLLTVQRAGKSVVAAQDFLRGFPISQGESLS